MAITNTHIRATIRCHVDEFPEDEPVIRPLAYLLADAIDVTTRTETRGHVTASAVVVNDAGMVLMVHHLGTGEWFQPGGHPEGVDIRLSDVAKRETSEETGIPVDALKLARLDPIHVDYHVIEENPARFKPECRHFDFRYLFYTSAPIGKIQPKEVGGADWFTPHALHDDVLRDRVLTFATN